MTPFTFEILTPDRVFFRGEITSLIVTTKHGEMGILYNSMPLVTTLDSGTIKFCENNKWLTAIAGEGFVNIRSKWVTVLAQSCDWPHEINDTQLKDEIDELTEVLKKKQSLTEHKIAKAQLARQLAKLRIKSKSD